MFIGCVCVHVARIRKHGFKFRHVMLLITAVLLMIDLLNNCIAYPAIQYRGSIDLFPYYVVRSLSFVPSGATHTIVILNRITLLVVLPNTRRTFLLVSTAIVTLADLIAIGGMWDATLKVAPIGTLDEWQWRWRFPFYGVAASAVFPLINVIACVWSLRAAFLMSRGPAGSNAETGAISIGQDHSTIGTSSFGGSSGFASHHHGAISHHSVAAASSSSAGLNPSHTCSSIASSTGQSRAKVTDAPKRLLRAVSKLSERCKASESARRPSVSATEASITRSFWMLTLAEILCWIAFMATIGSGTPTLPLFARNAVYSCYGMVGVSVETAFENVYKIEYARASNRPSTVKALDPGTGVRTSHVSYKVAELEANGHLGLG
ncbi:hypothetical protein BCR44DRAFT_42457 [Catenaria anguillulae PL171]|uniref:Uncharacterized protein n=1 Tax=Catenaria anguillulae PL171 TaxID=765915 RepID=A0A1Y2I2N9_9FUNG|nr:hypothetical protein BCR44DRAFT_42457 [Catenaria anguillulae PL171]